MRQESIYFFPFVVGHTERQILSAIEEVVDDSLPEPKLTEHFQDPEGAKLYVVNKISFCEARQKVHYSLLQNVRGCYFVMCTLIWFLILFLPLAFKIKVLQLYYLRLDIFQVKFHLFSIT